MAITVQYGSVGALATAGNAAGVGSYNQYLMGLQQEQQKIQQQQQRINLDVQRTIQTERMQQTDIGFRDVLSQRDIALSDRDRQERLANSNEQLLVSNAFQNQRTAFGEANTNARLGFSEANTNARTAAQIQDAQVRQYRGLVADQQSQAASIAANERMAGYKTAAGIYQQQLGAQLGAAENYQRAYLNNALSEAGFNRQVQYDAYNAAIQPSAQMQQFYQQRSELERDNNYAPADQQQLQRIQNERAQLRQQLTAGEIDPRAAQAYSTQLDSLEQGILPSQPKLKPSDRMAQMTADLPGYGKFLVPPDGSMPKQILGEKTNLELEREKLQWKAYGDQLATYKTEQGHLASLEQSRQDWIARRAQELANQANKMEAERYSQGRSAYTNPFPKVEAGQQAPRGTFSHQPHQFNTSQFLGIAGQEYEDTHQYDISRIQRLKSMQPPSQPVSPKVYQQNIQSALSSPSPQVQQAAVTVSQLAERAGGYDTVKMRQALSQMSPADQSRVKNSMDTLTRAGY